MWVEKELERKGSGGGFPKVHGGLTNIAPMWKYSFEPILGSLAGQTQSSDRVWANSITCFVSRIQIFDVDVICKHITEQPWSTRMRISEWWPIYQTHHYAKFHHHSTHICWLSKTIHIILSLTRLSFCDWESGPRDLFGWSAGHNLLENAWPV